MYNILAKSHHNVIGIKVEGQMTSQDYQTLLPFLTENIDLYGSIRVVTDLRKYSGEINWWGICKTLPFAFQYSSNVEKKAVITDQQWIWNWVRFFAPLFHTDVKCFSSSQVEEAWKWAMK